MSIFQSFVSEFSQAWLGAQDAVQGGHFWLLVLALLVACGFEFINGFHDTANAVATVIYTKSLKPWTAVSLSGICNFLGVFIGGTAVAMGIIKLLPVELLITNSLGVSLSMVFALLAAAIIWNFGTWYLGLPASSSHTMIGAILGIGLANAYASGAPIASGVNWSKAADIGLALLISPAFGFALSAGLLLLSKALMKNPEFHQAPKEGSTPPWKVRSLLVTTSAGVSFAHGSNDGQKGIGLIMLVLIGILPQQFALRPSHGPGDLKVAAAASEKLNTILHSDEIRVAANQPNPSLSLIAPAYADSAHDHPALKPDLAAAASAAQKIRDRLDGKTSISDLNRTDRLEVRAQILQLDRKLGKLEEEHAPVTFLRQWKQVKEARKELKSLTEYAPLWVVLMVALSLGIGTLFGWKRIVVTVGEKIGKSHLTYAQGASAELVAMSTIGVSAVAGLPVSTTHVLSSGIAGTMVAAKSGVQAKTVKSILAAWILTLPVSMGLSAGLFLFFLNFVSR
ncbi:MAG: inorganic phosphate transporter [Bdellovibrionales bacterium]|nr:inorganic phosphate transporter [Bdellovibrionales bacterium]